MATFQKLPPSFLVLYSDNSATTLRVPTPVLKEHRDFFLSKISVNLIAESRRSWDIEIEKIDDTCYFTDGWSDFVKDTNLIEGNHLLFHIVGNSTLQVSIFGHNCWLEEFEVEPPSYEMVVASTWRFVKELKKHNTRAGRMDIPKRFAEGTGIAASGKVTLQTEDGGEWLITVTNRNAQKYSMTSGWLDFVGENKLRKGAFLLFEFVSDSDNVVKVRSLEKNDGKKLVSQSSRGGFLA